MSIISHSVIDTNYNDLIEKIKNSIHEYKILDPFFTKEHKLSLLEKLTSFKLGRFLLEHKGLNGFWTEYICSYPARKKNEEKATENNFEKMFLEQIPIVLATQERYAIFKREIQSRFREEMCFASLPCGLMTDLISSEAKKYKQFKFIGIDLDIHAIEQAKTVALMNGLFHACEFYKMNAWELSFENEFDLLSSNGLNIYEKCDTKVTKLYQKFFNALKRKGTLILSTITPPPTLCEDSTWNMNVIHKENLLLQKVIFSDIIEAQFQCLRSVKQTQTQLASVGFREQEVFSDTQGMFVTIIARK